MLILHVRHISLLLCLTLKLSAQTPEPTTDFEQIQTILQHYIEGTANGEPERLNIAFHPDFQLYYVTESDSLGIRSGEKYVNNIKPSEKSNRIGRIISIDIEEDAAMAKAEIIVPNWRTFTDYFLLLKYQGSWKIIHKSYTWKGKKKTTEK